MDSQRSHYWSIKSARLYTTLLCCMMILAHGLMRVTLNMSMVCMVSSNRNNSDADTEVSLEPSSNLSSSCASTNSFQDEYQGPFNWGTYEQGLLFSACYIGGFIAILPAGWLSDRYSPKLLVTVATIITTITCLISPIVAIKLNYIGLFILRFIMGIFSSALISPAISSIMARWIPPLERSTAVGLYSTGYQLSMIIGMPLDASLCQSKFLGGWPAIFYINGIFGVIALILWLVFAGNRAETSKFISEKEKKYVISCLSQQGLGIRKEVTKTIPWKQMLTSPPLLCCLFSSFSIFFAMVTLQTYIPTYYKNALHMNMTNNGIFSALPSILQMISKVLFAVISDILKKKTKLSPTLISKIFNTLACIGFASFLIACSYITCSQSGLAVGLLCCASFLISGTIPGYSTSMITIAPAYSGILNSLGGFIGQIAAIVAPLIVSALTPYGTVAEWRDVFYLIALIVTIQCILYLLFGSMVIQDWAKPQKKIEIKISYDSSIKPAINDINDELSHENSTKQSTILRF